MSQIDQFSNYINTLGNTQSSSKQWAMGDFQLDDFSKIDLNHDNLLSESEFSASRLSSSLFKRIAGNDNKVDSNEWSSEISNLPFKGRWQQGNFDESDFKRIDFNKDNIIDLNDWKRNGLSEALFPRLTNASGHISTREWNYFVKNTVANRDRWKNGSFSSGDFPLIDYDKDSSISAADWSRNGLNANLFVQLSGGNKQISKGDWKYFIDTTLTNSNRWRGKDFQLSDFQLLDYDKDKSISLSDWRRNGLNGSLFAQVSGGSKQISNNDWGYFINTTLANNARWSESNFWLNDFKLIDHDRDNGISLADWQRNGLSLNLFTQVSGGNKEITGKDWEYFTTQSLPNRERWGNMQFNIADFKTLDFGKDDSVSAADWKRNGLSAKLFDQISCDSKSISPDDWKYFIKIALPNMDRWRSNQYTAADLNMLDHDSNGSISSDEWKRNGLDISLFGSWSGADKKIDNREWNYLLQVSLPNKERWTNSGFNCADFKLLDFDGNNLISAEEWQRNRLYSGPFAQISGDKKQININDWNYYLSTSLPNKQRWDSGSFSAADFKLIDYNQDNRISLDEWRKNGLGDKLFNQISGNCKHIDIADWNYFVNVSQPNSNRWKSNQFKTADFNLLDVNGDNKITLSDWKMNGLSEKLFGQVSGGNDQIVKGDWDYFVTTTLPNMKRWNLGNFTTADFKLLDINSDSFITLKEWQRNGLSQRLYDQIFSAA